MPYLTSELRRKCARNDIVFHILGPLLGPVISFRHIEHRSQNKTKKFPHRILGCVMYDFLFYMYEDLLLLMCICQLLYIYVLFV